MVLNGRRVCDKPEFTSQRAVCNEYSILDYILVDGGSTQIPELHVSAIDTGSTDHFLIWANIDRSGKMESKKQRKLFRWKVERLGDEGARDEFQKGLAGSVEPFRKLLRSVEDGQVVKELEAAQMTAAKIILGCSKRTSNAAVRAELGIQSLLSGRDARKLTWQYCMCGMGEERLPRIVWEAKWANKKRGRQPTEWVKGFKEKMSVACAEREEQNVRKESKDKEGLEVYGMLKEGIGFKDYLHGPMDAGTKLKVKFRTGDIGLRERRRRHGTVDEEDDEFKCDCGFECEDRVHVVAESSTEVAKTPKTEYQEHMQMARALSKSLVAPKATAVQDEASEEVCTKELARNPAAFRAKERRLVGVLKDLDVKLERLKKDRDSALRKLAAHRTLGARLSAGAGGVPSESSGGDGGGAPKTAEEVVDIIFADEHGAAAAAAGIGSGARTPLRVSTSRLSEEGRAQQRGATLLSSSPSSSSPVSLLSKGTAVADAAGGGSDAASGERPTTVPRRSRRERAKGTPAPLPAPEEDGASDGAAGKGGGGGGGFVAGARGTPPSGDNPRYDGDKGCWGDDDEDDEDDDTGVGRLIRRRSGGGANGNGQRSTPGGDGSRARRGRTLWAIAQGADELSQSDFVTGVFADIRANSTGGVGGGAGGKPHAAKPGRRAAVTAAAYGDARLYNRRVVSSAAASPSALSSTLCSDQGDTDEGMGGGRPGKSEREQSASQLNPSDENGGSGGDGDDAVDDVIQLLSQTLSQASVSGGGGGTASAQNGGQENGGKKQEEEEEEAERFAARHIARAPVSSLSGLFPNWKENVGFVFRQGAAELQEALQGIVTALSEEEEKEAEALVFFEGVILEALEARGPACSRQLAFLGEERRRDDGSHSPGFEVGSPQTWRRGSEGVGIGRNGGGAVTPGSDSPPRGGANSVQDSGFALEGPEERGSERYDGGGSENGEGQARVDGESGDHLSVADEATGLEETHATTAENNGHDAEPAAVGTDDGDAGTQSVGHPHHGDSSVEAIVLSGDSTASAVVTFDLTSSESSKRCSSAGDITAAAAAAAAAAAGGVAAAGLAEFPVGADGGGRNSGRGVTARARNGQEEEDEEDEENRTFAIVDSGGGGGGGANDAASSRRKSHRGVTASVRNCQRKEEEEQDVEFAMIDSGGGGGGGGANGPDSTDERGEASGDSDDVVDEYALEDEYGFDDHDYCAWGDENDLSFVPSPDIDGVADERQPPPPPPPPPPSPPLSPTQRPPDIDPPAAAAADKVSHDSTSAMGAELLDLTQVAPLPSPSLRRCRESLDAAAATSPIGRGRSQHRGLESPATARRRHHCTPSSPPVEGEEGASSPTAVGGNEDIAELREVMPSFGQMTLQELAGMMAVYGLKKKSKREMTERLEHIWKTLHPAAAEEGMSAAGDGNATSSSSSSSSSSRSRKRDAPSRDSGGDPSAYLSASSQGHRRSRGAAEARPTSSPAAAAAAAAVTVTSSTSIPRRPPLPRPPRGGGVPGAGDSRRGGFSQEEEAVPPIPSTCRSQQQQQQGFLAENSSGRNGVDADLGERIRSVIMGYAPLHEDILLLKTVDLSAIHTLIKNAGVKCTKKDLASYLDSRGITFIDRGGVKRRARGGERETEGEEQSQRKKKKKRRPGATGTAAGRNGAVCVARDGTLCR
ncbi:unnamed protein product [Ectocarpus sp. CCAP 1310/34]|nr:unnamed protein product [Ectocarpus sp. CCAP 1310/34]